MRKHAYKAMRLVPTQRKSGLEGSDNLTHLLGALVDELQPEVPNPSLEPQWQVFRANLRFGPEDFQRSLQLPRQVSKKLHS